jgi:hypothetical protein
MNCVKHLAVSLIALTSASSFADQIAGAIPLIPKAEQECSACHMAYRPNFLPKSSWQKVMTTLDKHYGVDASLTAADQKEIADWLNATALDAGEAPPENRGTKAFWFTRKHGTRHIATDVWARTAVKSPSNCQACHVDAAKGDFNERNIRIPR